jgi:hypothetical protein
LSAATHEHITSDGRGTSSGIGRGGLGAFQERGHLSRLPTVMKLRDAHGSLSRVCAVVKSHSNFECAVICKQPLLEALQRSGTWHKECVILQESDEGKVVDGRVYSYHPTKAWRSRAVGGQSA